MTDAKLLHVMGRWKRISLIRNRRVVFTPHSDAALEKNRATTFSNSSHRRKSERSQELHKCEGTSLRFSRKKIKKIPIVTFLHSPAHEKDMPSAVFGDELVKT